MVHSYTGRAEEGAQKKMEEDIEDFYPTSFYFIL